MNIGTKRNKVTYKNLLLPGFIDEIILQCLSETLHPMQLLTFHQVNIFIFFFIIKVFYVDYILKWNYFKHIGTKRNKNLLLQMKLSCSSLRHIAPNVVLICVAPDRRYYEKGHPRIQQNTRKMFSGKIKFFEKNIRKLKSEH